MVVVLVAVTVEEVADIFEAEEEYELEWEVEALFKLVEFVEFNNLLCE